MLKEIPSWLCSPPRLLLVLGFALCAATTLLAGLCPKCQQSSHTKDIGSCKLCKGLTSSGEFQLCPACSERLVPHTTATSGASPTDSAQGSRDFYFAIAVEAPSPKGDPR